MQSRENGGALSGKDLRAVTKRTRFLWSFFCFCLAIMGIGCGGSDSSTSSGNTNTGSGGSGSAAPQILRVEPSRVMVGDSEGLVTAAGTNSRQGAQSYLMVRPPPPSIRMAALCSSRYQIRTLILRKLTLFRSRTRPWSRICCPMRCMPLSQAPTSSSGSKLNI